jgi:PAS domain S-box-containing protein
MNYRIFQRAEKKSEYQFNQNQYLQTSIATQGLREVLEGVERGMVILGTYSLVDFLEGKRTPLSIENLFGIQLRASQHLVSYAFFTHPGGPSLFQSNPSPEGAKGMELAQSWISQYWEEARSLPEGTLFFLPPYLNPQKQFLGVLYPVHIKGDFQGILLGVLDLCKLSLDYVAPLRSGEYGAGFLLSGTGEVLYDHETEIIGRNIFDGLHEAFPELMELDARLMQEASGEGEYSFSRARSEGTTKVRKLVAWDSLRTWNLRLVVALSAPDTEIDAFLRETKLFQTFSTTFLVLFMGGGLFLFFRWNANRGIRENEERLKLALQGNQDGLWDYNPIDGTCFYAPRWKEILGYKDEEISNRFEEWNQRIHPEDREETLKNLEEHLEGHTPNYENEHRLLCKNGSYKWVHARGMVLERTSQGKAKRVLGTNTDVDLRKKIESEFRKFSLAVEQSPVAAQPPCPGSALFL